MRLLTLFRFSTLKVCVASTKVTETDNVGVMSGRVYVARVYAMTEGTPAMTVAVDLKTTMVRKPPKEKTKWMKAVKWTIVREISSNRMACVRPSERRQVSEKGYFLRHLPPWTALVGLAAVENCVRWVAAVAMA